MATFHTAALNHQGKITKSRARSTVKPILKKLHSSSQSEKNSLDLDRAWDDQLSPYAPETPTLGKQSLDGTYNYHYFTPTQPPPQRDVSFDLTTTPTANTAPPSSAAISHTTTNSTTATTASHNRSTSGASHISTATTTSAGRNGSFVHPFQQTPRTSTPPLLSYAASYASLGGEANRSSRDCSATTITETDDNLDDSFPLPQPGARPLQPTLPHLHSNTGYRRPSLGSQRTSSLSEQPSSLRIATRAPQPIPSVSIVADPPIAPSPTPQTATTMSPLRNSLDMDNFRIRSRSDVDTATRQEQVRVARRKFEEKEKLKEEKYARAEVRKKDRAGTRETRAAHSRKSSFGTSGRTSSSDVTRRPGAEPRKSTSHSIIEKPAQSPGLGITGHDMYSTSNGAYEDITGTTEAQPVERSAEEVHFEPNHRSGKAAKRKTQGTWTAFVLWFRTRLLKLGRR